MKRFLSIDEAGEGILQAGRRMYERGFVAANDGNMSVRLSDDRLWLEGRRRLDYGSQKWISLLELAQSRI